MNGMTLTWQTCLTAGIALLFLGIFFKTLMYAFIYSEEAGLSRLEEKYPEARRRLARWTRRWPVLISTLNVCATVCAVGFIALTAAALLIGRVRDGRLAAAAVVVIGLLILLMEIVPRALADSYADRLSVAFIPLIGSLAFPLWPVVWPLARLERALHRRLFAQSDEDDRPTPEDEIMSLVEQTDEEDLEEEERDIIRSVFEFGETVAREIMIPRVDIAGIEDVESIQHAAERLLAGNYSRLLVFHDSIDDVRGVVHVKELMRLLLDGSAGESVSAAVREVPFVPESMPINDLLQLLRARHSQIAVVVDEYGGTAGLVSMEDVIEELVGDIHDEYDERKPELKRMPDGSIIVDAKTPVDEVNEWLGIRLPDEEEYDSVGGYIFSRLGRVPRPGETMEGEDFVLTVQAADARKVLTVRVAAKGNGER